MGTAFMSVMNNPTGEYMQADDPTAAVIGMDYHEVDELLALLVSMDIEIARPPRAGLVMMKVTDSLATDFYVGEVLVTEAEVTLNGQRGYGMIIGEEPRKALARAATDALLRGGQPEVLCREVCKCLEHAQQRQREKNAAEAALIASTRVSFDLMAGA
jgi:alpha-D-ribose 1-methylphosphonate 5-triphosphate synthase subunit PhnG